MRQELLYHMTEQDEGNTVGWFLRSRGYSKHLIVALKQRKDDLTIGGQTAYVNHRIRAGETLRVRLPQEEPDTRIMPTAMPLSIVYEDEDILVINKDAGVPIHPSQGHQTGTLANGLMYYFSQKGEPFTYRVINRLDRDTTGLVLVARHALSACALAGQLQKRRIRRTYLAAVQGDLRDVFPDGSGIVDAPIARVPGSTIERRVDAVAGETAVTHVRLLSYRPVPDVSLAELHLDTGRTHQIRVHMKYIGHPLFGDFLYHPDYRYIRRQSLHSWKLDFFHPVSGAALSFTAPVPEDMQCFL